MKPHPPEKMKEYLLLWNSIILCRNPLAKVEAKPDQLETVLGEPGNDHPLKRLQTNITLLVTWKYHQNSLISIAYVSYSNHCAGNAPSHIIFPLPLPLHTGLYWYPKRVATPYMNH